MEINKNSSNKKGLGRGVGALLGGAGPTNEFNQSSTKVSTQADQKKEILIKVEASPETEVKTENKIWLISVDKLVPGVFQPRKRFHKESIEELAQSIKQNGILQPITARKRAAGGFEIIAGERRWRAAQSAGLHEVPVIIKNLSDNEALQMAIIENVQREDLDPIEEAEGYQRLMQEFSLSQQQVCEKVGKERSTIANALRLIGLPSEIKDLLADKMISTGHAKVLLSIADRKEQIKQAKNCAEKQMSVRALEQAIKFADNLKKSSLSENEQASGSPLKTDLSQRLAKDLADQLQKNLGTKVNINYKAGKGDLTIHFYTDEQLNSIYEKIKK
jgi:ParB family transcriptional regulator, chromosome partitioning protein